MKQELEELYQQLNTSKEISDKGLELITAVKKILDNMDKVCRSYEQGIQSESWQTNFQLVAGQKGSILAEQLYTLFIDVLKKTGYR